MRWPFVLLASVCMFLLPHSATAQIAIQAVEARPVVVNPAAESPDEEPAPPVSVPILHFVNGDTVAGRPANSTRTAIAWHSDSFTVPVHFHRKEVMSVVFPEPDTPRSSDLPFAFRLANGSVIYGAVDAVDANNIVVRTDRFGILTFDRALLQSMHRRKQATAEGDEEEARQAVRWKTSTSWEREANHWVTREAGATLRGAAKLPRQVVMELALSWQTDGDFTLVIDDGSARSTNSFRIEAWDESIVVVRETTEDAAVAVIQKVDPRRPQRLDLTLYVNQEEGTCSVYSADGDNVAAIPTGSFDPSDIRVIRLMNHGHDLRLENLLVRPWDGVLPESAKEGEAHLTTRSGDRVVGSLVAYDAEKKLIKVESQDEVVTVAVAELQSLFFSMASATTPAAWKVVTQTRQVVAGQLESIDEQFVTMDVVGVVEPVTIPTMDVRVLRRTQMKPEAKAAVDDEQPALQLESSFTTLRGVLAPRPATPEGGMYFLPTYAEREVALRPDADARLIFLAPAQEKPKASKPTARASRQAPPVFAQGVAAALRRLAVATPTKQTKPPEQKRARQTKHVLHLRSGDVIGCNALRVDEDGIHFETEVTETGFVAHDRVKALELMPDVNAVKIAKSKIERLLMLPRSQRSSPPTHLVRSQQGDYLRCRLVAMNESTVTVEVRLEDRTLPRPRIARLLWLHSDAETSDTAEQWWHGQVQAVNLDGSRLTFHPERVEDKTIIGRTELLGEVRVELDTLSALLVGRAIERTASSLAFHRWRLTDAPDPLPPPTTEGGESGEQSPLVGKPAPEIKLAMLDGSTFTLSEHRGRVVVLDFWASWCGPCLQTMPKIDKVVGEFDGECVLLVGINLEETAERATAALERLDLEMPVALDEIGSAAQDYGATAIPQTVIIDADGNVARVFVGGGPSFDDQFRDALTAVLEGSSD